MISVSKSRDQEVRPVFVKVAEITFKEAADTYLNEVPIYFSMTSTTPWMRGKTLKRLEES